MQQWGTPTSATPPGAVLHTQEGHRILARDTHNTVVKGSQGDRSISQQWDAELTRTEITRCMRNTEVCKGFRECRYTGYSWVI